MSGFNFKRLVERKPELKQELLGFRDYLLASSSADESLKVTLPPFCTTRHAAKSGFGACARSQYDR